MGGTSCCYTSTTTTTNYHSAAPRDLPRVGRWDHGSRARPRGSESFCPSIPLPVLLLVQALQVERLDLATDHWCSYWV